MLAWSSRSWARPSRGATVLGLRVLCLGDVADGLGFRVWVLGDVADGCAHEDGHGVRVKGLGFR